MTSSSGDSTKRRISVDLPTELISCIDELKTEWSLRSRGDVLKRLLEEITLTDEQKQELDTFVPKTDKYSTDLSQQGIFDTNSETYISDKALVLVQPNSLTKEPSIRDEEIGFDKKKDKLYTGVKSVNKSIDLPGFVGKKTKELRNSLGKTKQDDFASETYIHTVPVSFLEEAKKSAINHWLSLYGQPPKADIVEAAMLWLARDIWPHIDGNEDSAFTWKQANKLMNSYCPRWKVEPPTLESIVVIAGVLEDPFATEVLKTRIPTLVRRFVNRFKRSRSSTSFQTLESTMTVVGALKLLDLPTHAGASLTLGTIKDAYRLKGKSSHPDAGGTTEQMRRLNEAYNLLKELYRGK